MSDEWTEKAEKLMKKLNYVNDDPLSPEELAASLDAWAKVRGTGTISASVTHDGFLVTRVDIRPHEGGVMDGNDRIPITEPYAQEEMKRYKLSKPGDSTVMILNFVNGEWLDGDVITPEEYKEYLKNR
jgi:hypothetical protein